MIKRKSFYVAFEGDKMVSKDDLRDACDFTLYVPQQNTDYSLEQSLLRFQKLLDLTATKKTEESILLDAGKWSHFLSLTAPKVESLKSILSDLRVGIDAFELRVDLLEDKSPLSLHRQLAVLRDNCPLPIVYTVRTKSQIGQYPDDDYQGIISLLWEGLRAGVEWLDVEASLPKDVLLPFLEEAKRKYPSTKLLGSLHKTTPCSSEELLNMFEACDLYGYADMLKVVTGAEDRSHCEMVHSVGKQQQKPYIGLCLGDAGSYSRVLNERFTPVTHNMLSAAAPGQLTVEQLMEQREKDGLISMKNYYLFGSPIQHSLSPAMHNGGYKALLLPHQYDLCEQDSIEPYMSKIKDSTFGGASVTIPHKEAIIPMLDEVIGAAATIGAVNTIVKGKDGKLRGYNTDYLGIKKPIARILDRRGFQAKSKFTITRTDKETGKPDNKDCTCGKANSKGIGIVIGAGALLRLLVYHIILFLI